MGQAAAREQLVSVAMAEFALETARQEFIRYLHPTDAKQDRYPQKWAELLDELRDGSERIEGLRAEPRGGLAASWADLAPQKTPDSIRRARSASL